MPNTALKNFCSTHKLHVSVYNAAVAYRDKGKTHLDARMLEQGGVAGYEGALRLMANMHLWPCDNEQCVINALNALKP